MACQEEIAHEACATKQHRDHRHQQPMPLIGERETALDQNTNHDDFSRWYEGVYVELELSFVS